MSNTDLSLIWSAGVTYIYICVYIYIYIYIHIYIYIYICNPGDMISRYLTSQMKRATPRCMRWLLHASTMLIHCYAAFHTTLQRFQRVQYCAARLVSRTRIYHITSELQLPLSLICYFHALFRLHRCLIGWLLSTVRFGCDSALIQIIQWVA